MSRIIHEDDLSTTRRRRLEEEGDLVCPVQRCLVVTVCQYNHHSRKLLRRILEHPFRSVHQTLAASRALESSHETALFFESGIHTRRKPLEWDDCDYGLTLWGNRVE